MGYVDAISAVQGWGNERKGFDFGSPDFHHDTGHFTQLVWKATQSVGCGRYYCGRQRQNGDNERAHDWYLVCHYYPMGNVVGGDLFHTNIQSPRSTIPMNSGVSHLSHSTNHKFWTLFVVIFTIVLTVL